MHHDLIPYMGLPDDYKLGYKVTKYSKFQHYSCSMSLDPPYRNIPTIVKGLRYYYYKWTYAPHKFYPLCCFKYIMDAYEFHKEYLNRDIKRYIVPCAYIPSNWNLSIQTWFKHYAVWGDLSFPQGTQLASKIMLVGDLIVP